MADITFTINSFTYNGKQANGTLSWPANSLTISAVSGRYGKGYLPTGLYDAKRAVLLDKSDAAYKDLKGLGWMQVLSPNFTTDRTDLGIHPDGNVTGTEGCIGIEPADTKIWFDAFKANTGTLSVEVKDASSHGIQPEAVHRLTVFVAGSATKEHAAEAESLGACLAEWGCHLITGGRDGVMRSVARGFMAVPHRLGLTIGILPGSIEHGKAISHKPNPYIEVPILTQLPGSKIVGDVLDPCSRNYIEVLSADLVIGVGGEDGTRSEIIAATTHNKPVILFGPKCDWHAEIISQYSTLTRSMTNLDHVREVLRSLT